MDKITSQTLLIAAFVDILAIAAAILVVWALIWPKKYLGRRLPVPDWNAPEPLVLLDIQSMHPDSVIADNAVFADNKAIIEWSGIPEYGIDKGVTYVGGSDGSEFAWNPDPIQQYVTVPEDVDIPAEYEPSREEIENWCERMREAEEADLWDSEEVSCEDTETGD